MAGMFHELDVLAPEENPADVRVFEGDGTPFLFVPGLQDVRSVRVGATPIPLTERRKIPLDAGQTQFGLIDIELVNLARDGDGRAVLRRNVMSNDGLWQKGQRIYVGGEWIAEETPHNVPVTVTAHIPTSVDAPVADPPVADKRKR